MNEHLTEQQLIDYQFKLADEASMQEALAHLEQCQVCRQRLDALARKFASLDLLRDEIKASDTLIAKTVAHAASPGPARALRFRLPWLGAAAAAVIVGFAVLLTSLDRKPARYETAKSRQSHAAPTMADEDKVADEPERFVAADRRVEDGSVKAEGLRGEGVPPLRPDGILPAEREQGQDALATKDKGKMPSPRENHRQAALDAATQPPGGATTNMLDAGARQVHPGAIDDKPPFAPASAIELVVLPRRENVQLTIYNAADLTLVRERRNLTLKRGWNWLQFMWANTLIDPTSLTLEPLEHKDQVEVQQLVFPPRLRELGR